MEYELDCVLAMWQLMCVTQIGHCCWNKRKQVYGRLYGCKNKVHQKKCQENPRMKFQKSFKTEYEISF